MFLVDRGLENLREMGPAVFRPIWRACRDLIDQGSHITRLDLVNWPIAPFRNQVPADFLGIDLGAPFCVSLADVLFCKCREGVSSLLGFLAPLRFCLALFFSFT